MVSKRPFKINDLLKKLRPYGIEPMARARGKGSEIILVKPEKEGSMKGPQYPIKHHGKQTEISYQTVMAILRRFDINPEEFWN